MNSTPASLASQRSAPVDLGSLRDGTITGGSNIASSPHAQASGWSGVRETAQIEKAASRLTGNIARDPSGFSAALELSLGSKASHTATNALIDAARLDQLPLPTVRFVDRSELGSSDLGAYASGARGMILLDRVLLDDDARLEAVFTREMGHHFGALVGGMDAHSSDGEVFARALLGSGMPSDQVPERSRDEYDRTAIQLGAADHIRSLDTNPSFNDTQFENLVTHDRYMRDQIFSSSTNKISAPSNIIEVRSGEKADRPDAPSEMTIPFSTRDIPPIEETIVPIDGGDPIRIHITGPGVRSSVLVRDEEDTLGEDIAHEVIDIGISVGTEGDSGDILRGVADIVDMTSIESRNTFERVRLPWSDMEAGEIYVDPQGNEWITNGEGWAYTNTETGGSIAVGDDSFGIVVNNVGPPDENGVMRYTHTLYDYQGNEVSSVPGETEPVQQPVTPTPELTPNGRPSDRDDEEDFDLVGTPSGPTPADTPEGTDGEDDVDGLDEDGGVVETEGTEDTDGAGETESTEEIDEPSGPDGSDETSEPDGTTGSDSVEETGETGETSETDEPCGTDDTGGADATDEPAAPDESGETNGTGEPDETAEPEMDATIT